MGKPYAEVTGDPIAQSKSPAILGYRLGMPLLPVLGALRVLEELPA